MEIAKSELTAILSQFNPWWSGKAINSLPQWRRAAFRELFQWIYSPPAPRAVLLSGARQVGKTTLLLQAIQELLKKEVPPSNILYVTFDHPLIKMAGIDEVLKIWRERELIAPGPEYLFLDEAQFVIDWGTWVKHQVDFNKNRRIIFTGSAMPLIQGQESGVGRWHAIKLSTLSFYEYLQLEIFAAEFAEDEKKLLKWIKAEGKMEAAYIRMLISNKLQKLPQLPALTSLDELFDWDTMQFQRTIELASPYVAHFHQYLLRGGFPQLAQVESVTEAQRLIREDIVEKVLKRDMTALFGVRRVLDLEQTFLYLCLHDGGLLDMPNLCSNLEVKRPTAQHFIDLLEATHLIYRLQPFGYGKDILRAKYKIYLADPAIAPSILLKGKGLLDDPSALGVAIETAVFKHLYAHSAQHLRFTYWHGDKNHEVDLVMEDGNKIIPFEIKCRAQHIHSRDLKGLMELCRKKSIKKAYVVTKSLNDFGPMINDSLPDTKIMKIPAVLICYWLGVLELSPNSSIF